MLDIYQTLVFKNNVGNLVLRVDFELKLPGSKSEFLSSEFEIEAFPMALHATEHVMHLGAQKLALLFKDLSEEAEKIASAYAEGKIP